MHKQLQSTLLNQKSKQNPKLNLEIGLTLRLEIFDLNVNLSTFHSRFLSKRFLTLNNSRALG